MWSLLCHNIDWEHWVGEMILVIFYISIYKPPVLADQFSRLVVMAKCQWLKRRNHWVASGCDVIVWLKIAPPPNTLTPSYHHTG
jgi:hypothetical protein